MKTQFLIVPINASAKILELTLCQEETHQVDEQIDCNPTIPRLAVNPYYSKSTDETIVEIVKITCEEAGGNLVLSCDCYVTRIKDDA